MDHSQRQDLIPESWESPRQYVERVRTILASADDLAGKILRAILEEMPDDVSHQVADVAISQGCEFGEALVYVLDRR